MKRLMRKTQNEYEPAKPEKDTAVIRQDSVQIGAEETTIVQSTAGEGLEKKVANPPLETMTPQQQKNEKTKQGILANMELGERYTIGDMLMTFDCFDLGTTPQRVSALLVQMGARGTGQIVRTEDQGKVYFSIAEVPNNEEKLQRILANMEAGKRYTIGDMLMDFDCFESGTSPQRVSALLSRLGEKGTQQIIRKEANGKAYFSLAQGANESEKEAFPPPQIESSPRIPETQLAPQQQKNEETKQGILANMELGERYTIDDMLMTFDCFDLGTTPQRVSALLAQMGAKGTGQIVRTEDQGKAYFSIAMVPDNEEKLQRILANMKAGKRYTIGDMLMNFDCFEPGTSPQRVSALLSQFGERGSGDISRSVENGRTYYTLTDKGKKGKENITKRQINNSPVAESKEPPRTVKSTSTYVEKGIEQRQRINYFLTSETVNAVFQMKFEGDDDYYFNNAFTIDLIDGPFLLFYKSDSNSCSLEVDARYEVYDHTEHEARLEGNAVLRKGEGLRAKSKDSVQEIMPALMVFCSTLSAYIKKHGYSTKFAGLDPEEAGVLLEEKNGELTARVVQGSERPEMMCKTLSGDVVSCRPYKSDLRAKLMEDLIKHAEKQRN